MPHMGKHSRIDNDKMFTFLKHIALLAQYRAKSSKSLSNSTASVETSIV